MALYKAILAYDGTDFHGFQRQAEERTVQGEVEAALRKIGWNGASILGAGRTDAGVHASGQVISFEMDWSHGPDDLQNALNAGLPRDASVRYLAAAEPGFHPRFDAAARRYVYRLHFDPARDPLVERYAWRIWPAPDLDLLDETAGLFEGRHDYAGFGRPPKPGGPTEREVFESRWMHTRHGAVYAIEGNAFLYRMVRRIVHAQIEAARGNTTTAALKAALKQPASEMVKGLAPARGLRLDSVVY